MRFALLGTMTVSHEGEPIEVRGSLTKAVLAVLLLNAGTTVSHDELIAAVWGADPPASATSSLRNQLARLRQMLGPAGGARIKTGTAGYLIQIEPGELDLEVFADLCSDGRRALRDEQWAKASDLLSDALRLWRGAPLADVPGLFVPGTVVQGLLETRIQALEGRIEADLNLGRHGEVLVELQTLTAENPLRESLHAQQMLALYRLDRQAEALDVFQNLRSVLVEELGVEPCAAVQRLHQRILGNDADLGYVPPSDVRGRPSGPATTSPRSDRVGARHQLPADTRVFTGRSKESDELVALALRAPNGTEGGMVVISAIDGMAGIGKTALAVHVAHRMSEEFPDGQLFIDLHGHTPGLEPMPAEEALDQLLRSLGYAPQSIPQDLGERAALYRHALSATRTLIVLDNASGTAQVRPLLPGSPGCLVLITSRRRLLGLDDAHSVALDTLSAPEAVALLQKVAGPGRIPDGDPAISSLISLCGNMPLAVRIIGARLRHSRLLRVEDVLEQLGDEADRLGYLRDEDRDLTAVFASSYSALPAEEQLLFRRLGLVPGPDFDAYAAANLTGTDHRTAARTLESLTDHNLVIEHAPGRFRFHDLTRLYARTVVGGDPGEVTEAAFDRLSRFYLHAAQLADAQIAHHAHSRPSPNPEASFPAPALNTRARALTWLHAEYANLVAAASHAATHGQPARAVGLAAALAAFLHQNGPWPQAVLLHQTALATARAGQDRRGEADALWELARVRHMLGDFAVAAEILEEALAAYRTLGDRRGEANTLLELGRANHMKDGFSITIEMYEQALVIYREIGERLGEAKALTDLARIRLMLADFESCVTVQNQALAIYRDLGDSYGEANALVNLGRARHLLGDSPGALGLMEAALANFRAVGDRQGEAYILGDQGHVLLETGETAAAIAKQEQALAIGRDLGNRSFEGSCLEQLGRAHLEAGNPETAIELIDEALAIFRSVGSRHGEAVALHNLGRARHALGDLKNAAELLDEAAELFRDMGGAVSDVSVLNDRAAVTIDLEGPSAAAVQYREALALAREASSPANEGHALRGLATCSARLGDLGAAETELRQAVDIYRRIGVAELGAASGELAELEERIAAAG